MTPPFSVLVMMWHHFVKTKSTGRQRMSQFTAVETCLPTIRLVSHACSPPLPACSLGHELLSGFWVTRVLLSRF